MLTATSTKAEVLRIVPAFERENRIRELIQLFVRERDPEKLKVLAAEVQHLLMLEGTVPPSFPVGTKHRKQASARKQRPEKSRAAR